MSLVTTASDMRSRRVRQSAATRAVLPPPTGPPIPMRTARPGAAGKGAWTWAVSRSSRCKEGRLRCVVELGQDVGQRAALGREQPGFAGGGGREAPGGGIRGDVPGPAGGRGRDGGDPQGVEPEQPDGGGAGTADEVVQGQRRCGGGIGAGRGGGGPEDQRVVHARERAERRDSRARVGEGGGAQQRRPLGPRRRPER